MKSERVQHRSEIRGKQNTIQKSPEENKIDIKIIRKQVKVQTKNLNTTDPSINNTFIMHNDSLYTVNNNPSNVLGYHTLPH